MTRILVSILAALCCALGAAGPAAADWAGAAPLETPGEGLSAVESGGLVYVAGGSGLLAPQDVFAVYDPAADSWTPLPSLPVGLTRHGMAAAEGKIYVAGGFGKDPEAPSSALWIYDTQTEMWTEGPAMPTGRANFSLTALDGRLYAAGSGRLIAFDLAEQIWTDLGLDPAPGRRRAAAVAHAGGLWVIGGVTGAPPAPEEGEEADEAPAELKPEVRVDIYDPVSAVWTRGPDLPAPGRYAHAVASVGGDIHVLGGRNGRSETMSDHLVLAAGAEEAGWALAQPLPSPRAGMAAAGLDGALLVLGGGAGGGFFAPFTALDSVDRFSAEAE